MASANESSIPYSRKELHDPDIRAFAEMGLQSISMPLGGIGTGCVGLGGRGNLRDWEIFGQPNVGWRPEYTLPMIHCRTEGHSVTRILERRLMPPFVAGGGLWPGELAGMPRLAEAVFVAAYPFGRVQFEDDALPIEVSLEAFNPFIPSDAEASSLPVAILTYRLHNPTDQRVTGTLAWNLANCVGAGGRKEEVGPDAPHGFGANVNEYRIEKTVRGLFMTSQKYQPDQLGFGTMALMTPAEHTTVATGWLEPGWSWDKAQKIWDDFAADGRLDGPVTPTSPSEDGKTHIATLGVEFDLPPGQTDNVIFVLAWHFPWRRVPDMQPTRGHGLIQAHYATRFDDAWAVGIHTLEHVHDLRAQSRSFEEALLDTTLPGHVLEAVATQTCILKTNTVLWLDTPAAEPGGRIMAFEGCSDKSGCCPMNCTHVWNYEQTLAHLFPELERTMRLTDFEDNLHDSGAMSFRTALPLGTGLPVWCPQNPAADGQFGTVVKLYRDWQLCGELDFLERLYPAAKAALDFAQSGFAKWDADGDGVLEGIQHNTYDIDFHGPNTMVGSLYIAGLLAGIAMAEAMGDEQSANRWRQLADKARTGYEKLFNGEYYRQDVVEHAEPFKDGWGKEQPAGRPKYQHGQGCLSDQLLGQWAAHVAGLGHVLEPAHVRQAMESIFRHNWRADLSDHESVQRTYALNDEAGLLLCTWPRGERETFPFPYSDEVWTGIEYQVAAGLIYEGFVDEGLAIVYAIRERHDGFRRNPYDEPECGHYYARALASWSVLLALTGQRYSAVEQSLRVAPAINEREFRCLVTLGNAWGRFGQDYRDRKLLARLEVSYGQTALRTLQLAWPGEKAPASVGVSASRNDSALDGAAVRIEAGQLEITLAEPVTLAAGDALQVEIR